MFTVADQLIVEGLDDDTRGAVERYIESRTTRYLDTPSPDALRGAYEKGYRAGVADARAGMAHAAQGQLPLAKGEL